MGKLIAAMGSSHAYTFADPSLWDQRRDRTRSNYEKRYGEKPPEQAQVSRESTEENRRRFARIRGELEFLRAKLWDLKPDVLIMIGDDQDENFGEDGTPQYALYTGDSVIAVDKENRKRTHYKCDDELSWTLLRDTVDSGFDVAFSRAFADDELLSHAHQQPLDFLCANQVCPIIPVFVNAIHIPGPAPERCYQFGQALRRSIDAEPSGRRVVLYASGGWSHFTAGYPWPHYEGPYSVGSISEDFDRELVQCLERGELERLAKLSSHDLLANGGVELRQWIIMLGAIGKGAPERLVYEPFYRGVMGMAVGYWSVQ